MAPFEPSSSPAPTWSLRVARGLGVAGLVAALVLAASAPRELATDTGWWSAWLAASAVLLFAFPLTMLALWRNAHHRPLLDDGGVPRTDPRGRPLRRRVEHPGSRTLLLALALQSGGLLVLVGTLVAGALRG